MTQQLYRIEEAVTTGWQLIEQSSQKLTKEVCKQKLDAYLAEGYNPKTLRVVYDND